MTTTQIPTSSLELFELKPGVRVSYNNLRKLLPDVETALFFAKVYELGLRQLGDLLQLLFNTPVIEALMSGDHSTELQDYVLDTIPSYMWPAEGPPVFVADPPEPKGEILPELWEAAQVKVAQSIKEVADKLGPVLSSLPSLEGQMVFKSMAQMNKLRPTVGVYAPHIHHQPVPQVAVVLDVSGSMTSETVRTLLPDVIGMSYLAKAHLFVVSDTATHWEPGSYNEELVLQACEFGGTRYERLTPYFNTDWGTVITIADYDSSRAAFDALSKCTGRIGKLLDISLVDRATYLGECLGQLADEVEPLLVSNGVINGYYW